MRHTRRLLVIAVVTSITCVGVLPSAHAADAPAAKLMTTADLATFGGATSGSFDISARDTALPNVACVGASGQSVTFPNAPGWDANAQVNAKKRYVDVTESVIEYPTQDAANQAWQALTQAVATCPARALAPTNPANTHAYERVTQSSPPVAGGLATLQRSVAVDPDPRINGSSVVSYRVYRQAGATIIEVQYYSNPGATVNASIRTKVNGLASKLATRWLQGSGAAS